MTAMECYKLVLTNSKIWFSMTTYPKESNAMGFKNVKAHFWYSISMWAAGAIQIEPLELKLSH